MKNMGYEAPIPVPPERLIIIPMGKSLGKF